MGFRSVQETFADSIALPKVSVIPMALAACGGQSAHRAPNGDDRQGFLMRRSAQCRYRTHHRNEKRLTAGGCFPERPH